MKIFIKFSTKEEMYGVIDGLNQKKWPDLGKILAVFEIQNEDIEYCKE